MVGLLAYLLGKQGVRDAMLLPELNTGALWQSMHDLDR